MREELATNNLLTNWLRSNKIRALDHALGASLKRLRPDTPDVLCALVAATSYAHSLGHTALPLASVTSLWQNFSDEDVADFSFDSVFSSDVLRNSPWLSNENGVLALHDNALALRRYWHYEQSIALQVSTRCQLPTDQMDAERENYWHTLFSDQINSRQALAVKRCFENRFFLLTGGPGTGKTTVLGKLLALLSFKGDYAEANTPRIALAAPTGKAAMRMTEALRASLSSLQQQNLLSSEQQHLLSLRASTLHRLLGYQARSVNFLHHASHPLAIDILVLDEASMVDIPLLSKTLDALPKHARIIIIGDIAQLPSVELGHALRDIHHVFSHHSVLQKHHVHLDVPHRQRDAFAITQAADAIRDGDASAFFEHCRTPSDPSLDFVWNADSDSFEVTLIKEALPYFQTLAQAKDLPSAFSLSKQFRVLCASRDDEYGVINVNRRLSELLKQDTATAFYQGQCLMIHANHPREQLYNGDLGLCWPNAEGELRVWFETADGLKSWHPQALPGHEEAFAITIHKAQGSEFNRILLVLPDAEHRVLTRELLYTGLTRARLHASVWATPAAIEAAIQTSTTRWTLLASMLKRDIAI